MSDDSSVEATQALLDHTGGDERAADRLLPLVYDKLRGLAGKYLQRERPSHTLQPTALVHEAYIRMIDINRIDWRGKTHFFAMAARQMRRILVEHARSVSAKKRGEGFRKVTLDERLAGELKPQLDLLALNEALNKLAAESPRQAQVVELRLFAGMQVDEVAAALGVSERTVKGDWRMARAWLMRQLGGSTPGDD